MAKYLDQDGLSYFWGKAKGYLKTTYSPIGHSHDFSSAYAAKSHTHEYADLPNLASSYAGKSHTHQYADLPDLASTYKKIQTAVTSGTSAGDKNATGSGNKVTVITNISQDTQGKITYSYADIYSTDTTANQSISFSPVTTGDITGTASGTTSLTPTLTIGDGKVTTAKIAGSAVTTAKIADANVTNAKLQYSYIKIGSKSVNLGGTVTLGDLGLNDTLHFKGTINVSITDPSDDGFDAAVQSLYEGGTPASGDVIMNAATGAEYIYSNGWKEFGREGAYKVKQAAGACSGTVGSQLSHSTSSSNSYVVTGISQTADGVVTFTYSALPASGNTHYTTRLVVGAKDATSSSAQTNGNVYLTVTDDNTKRTSYKITGSGTVSVASAADGTITITGSAHTTGSGSAGSSTTTGDAWKTPLGYASLSSEHVLSGSDVTIPASAAGSTSANSTDGYMSGAQAFKLNGIAAGATADSALTQAEICTACGF